MGARRTPPDLPSRWIMFGISIVLMLVAWQSAVAAGVSKFVLPAPLDVLRAFGDFYRAIFDASLVTLSEVLLGFGLAASAGIVMATAITYSRTLAALLYPPLLFLNALPKIALAPILLLWLGFGIAMKVVVAFSIAFFPIVIETTSGLRSVDPDLHELARSLRSPRLFTFWKIDLPSALPSVFAGFKVAITLAVTGALVGEFISADRGLGFLIRSAVNQHLTPLAFAIVITISLLSAALFTAVVLVERLVIPWSRGRPRRERR